MKQLYLIGLVLFITLNVQSQNTIAKFKNTTELVANSIRKGYI